jgi:AcrR family transcriptional regulator
MRMAPTLRSGTDRFQCPSRYASPIVSTDSTPAPPRGRPRSDVVHEAILRATLELLAEVGVSGLTIEGVAARAGAGKATIYRRWSSKSAVVMAAIESLPALSVQPNGDTREDLIAILEELVRLLSATPLGGVFAHLATDRGRDPELDAKVTAYYEAQRAPIVAVLRTAAARGEIGDATGPEQLVDLFVGPVTIPVVFQSQPVDHSFVALVVDTALTGLRSPTPRRAGLAGKPDPR